MKFTFQLVSSVLFRGVKSGLDQPQSLRDPKYPLLLLPYTPQNTQHAPPPLATEP